MKTTLIRRLGAARILPGCIVVLFGLGVTCMVTAKAEGPFQVARTPRGADGVRETLTPGEVVEQPIADDQTEFAHVENPDRDVWIFNTRSASTTRPDEQQYQKISVQRLIQMHERKKSRWQNTSQNEFWLTYDPEVPLIVLVHGNYTSKTEAIESANMLENKFFPGSGKFAGARYRLVIWAWPADTIYKQHLKDAKLKSVFSMKQGEYLAQFLSQLPSDSRVSLVGFSFGARTTCEAVQRLSTNPEFFTQQGDENVSPNIQIRNLLLSPAIDQISLAPRFRYGNVIPTSQQSIVLYNPRDFALRLYPFLTGCNGPKALGRTGIPFFNLPKDLRQKISGINIDPIAGSRHSFTVFFQSPALNNRLGEFLLFAN